MPPGNIPILCYVTDRQSLSVLAGESRESALLERIRSAAAAGVTWIQIREKDLPARELVVLARDAVAISQAQPGRQAVRIVINDRADVSWAAGAAGVHLGEDAVSVREWVQARRALGRLDFIVGVSCHSQRVAVDAANEGADYVFFGPVFATPAKARFGPPQGVSRLAEVCHAVSVPVVAIGGITAENFRACLEAGAAGIAAIRLFQQTRDWNGLMATLRQIRAPHS